MSSFATRAAVAVFSICGSLALSAPSQAATALAHGECSGGATFGPFGEGISAFSTGCDINVAKFDASLGTLQSAKLIVNGFYYTSFVGNNPTEIDQTFDLRVWTDYYGMSSEEAFFPPPAFVLLGQPMLTGSGGTQCCDNLTFVDGADATPTLGFGDGGPVTYEFNFYGASLAGLTGPGTFNVHSIAGGRYNYAFSDEALTYGATITHQLALDITYDYVPVGYQGGVPEPATWAMMVLGFGVLGAAMRARRGAVAGL